LGRHRAIPAPEHELGWNPAVIGGVDLANVRGRSKRDGLAGQLGPIGSGRIAPTGLPDDETSEADVEAGG